MGEKLHALLVCPIFRGVLAHEVFMPGINTEAGRCREEEMGKECAMEEERRPGLTGEQLKLLALVCMTLDHVGLVLLPGILVLRVLGRLAFPIYAWMIGEGCRYTRDQRRYLGRLALLAAVCQVVNYVAVGSLYQCVLVTFSLSVAVIRAGDRAVARGSWLPLAAGAAAVLCLCRLEVPGTDFAIDYGLWGVLLPIGVYYGRTKGVRVLLAALCLTGLAWELGGIQWFGLAAVPLLAMYNGQRGRGRLGRVFYLYYPLHLAVIYAIALLFFS